MCVCRECKNEITCSATKVIVLFYPQQKFGIKTAGLEDKVTACQMLVIYARDLKEGFVEYAEPVSI